MKTDRTARTDASCPEEHTSRLQTFSEREPSSSRLWFTPHPSGRHPVDDDDDIMRHMQAVTTSLDINEQSFLTAESPADHLAKVTIELDLSKDTELPRTDLVRGRCDSTGLTSSTTPSTASLSSSLSSSDDDLQTPPPTARPFSSLPDCPAAGLTRMRKKHRGESRLPRPHSPPETPLRRIPLVTITTTQHDCEGLPLLPTSLEMKPTHRRPVDLAFKRTRDYQHEPFTPDNTPWNGNHEFRSMTGEWSPSPPPSNWIEPFPSEESADGRGFPRVRNPLPPLPQQRGRLEERQDHLKLDNAEVMDLEPSLPDSPWLGYTDARVDTKNTPSGRGRTVTQNRQQHYAHLQGAFPCLDWKEAIASSSFSPASHSAVDHGRSDRHRADLGRRIIRLTPRPSSRRLKQSWSSASMSNPSLSTTTTSSSSSLYSSSPLHRVAPHWTENDADGNDSDESAGFEEQDILDRLWFEPHFSSPLMHTGNVPVTAEPSSLASGSSE